MRVGTFIDGSFTIGDAFTGLPTLYSLASGSWFSGTIWTRDTTTGTAYGKAPNGNPVFIRTVHNVKLDANGASAASVKINGVLDAQNTTQHSLGQVSGGGRIRISATSSNIFIFPAGTYDAFLATSGSTVEFYGSINGRLPLDPGNTTKPYQNVVFSGSSTKYISSVDMKIIGNLTISSGSILDNTQYNKDVYILGNWIDSSTTTTTAGFVPGTGAVRFSGTTLQTVVMTGNSVTETFYNLAINNAAGLTFQTGSANVSGQLILTSGNINTNSTNALTITNTSSNAVSGGSNSSFVNGPLKKSIQSGSNFQFPVGDAVSSGRNRIGYVSVNSTSTSGTQIWTAQFFDKNAAVDGYDITKITSPLSSVIQNEYWSISGPSGGNANVVLAWDSLTGMNSSSSKRALARVAEWNTPAASTWNSVGASVTDNGQYSGTVATSILVGLDSHIFTIGAAMNAMLFTAVTGSNLSWNNASTWGGAGIPGLNDTVEIAKNSSVVLNSTVSIAKLIIDSSGTFNNSSSTLTLSGNLVINGSWIGSGGKISLTTALDTIFGAGTMTGSTLEIAGNKVIAATAILSLATVSILSPDTLFNYGIDTINSLTGTNVTTSVFVNLPGSTLFFSGTDLSTLNLVANQCSNTINYNGTVSQTVKPTTYCNLTVGGTGAKAINDGATITVHGDLTQIANTPFTIGIATIQIDGNLNTGDGFVNNGNINIGN